MNTIPSTVIENFRALNETFSKGTADNGRRFFPKNGLHTAIVTSMAISASEATVDGAKVPAQEIVFEYKLTEDPESPDNPRSFRGKPFILALNPALFEPAPGKKATRFSIERDRCLGHLYTINNRDPGYKGTFTDELALAYDRIVNGGTVIVELMAETSERPILNGPRKGEKFTDRTEKLVRCLSN